MTRRWWREAAHKSSSCTPGRSSKPALRRIFSARAYLHAEHCYARYRPGQSASRAAGVVPGNMTDRRDDLAARALPYATDECRAEEPALNQLDDGRQSKCHYHSMMPGGHTMVRMGPPCSSAGAFIGTKERTISGEGRGSFLRNGW